MNDHAGGKGNWGKNKTSAQGKGSGGGAVMHEPYQTLGGEAHRVYPQGQMGGGAGPGPHTYAMVIPALMNPQTAATGDANNASPESAVDP
eukprot:8654438-Karenia_brevis.AAC.1